MILLSLVAGAMLAQQSTGAGDGRGYVSGKFGLELDGIAAGFLQTANGGFLTSDVVTDAQASPDHVIHKHIAGVKYEDIAVTAGSGMSKEFYKWIKTSFDHSYSRKSGAVIACDFNYKERGSLAFQNGLISEVDFPALDAASKDACKMTVKWSPEITQFGVVQPPVSVKQPAPNDWQASNFAVVMPDFPNVTVEKYGRVKVQFHWDRDGKNERVDCSNITMSIPESEAKPFYAWYDDFVVKGNNGPKFTKTALVQYFNSDGAMSLALQGLGIMSVHQELDPLFLGTKRVQVEMYCEQVNFQSPK